MVRGKPGSAFSRWPGLPVAERRDGGRWRISIRGRYVGSFAAERAARLFLFRAARAAARAWGQHR